MIFNFGSEPGDACRQNPAVIEDHRLAGARQWASRAAGA